MTSRRAFTLLELLVVVVIIGIIVTVAIPRFANTKNSAYIAQLKSDLRNMVLAQEGYFSQYGAYATDVSQLVPMFMPSPRNTLTIIQASAGGWSGTATSLNTSSSCAVFFGVAAVAPATVDGQIACQ